MDAFVHDEEMDALLQDMSLEELHEFARTVEDNPSDDGGQTELLSSVNLFIFSKTGNLRYLRGAIRKAVEAVEATPASHPERSSRLKGLGNKLAICSSVSPPNATSIAGVIEPDVGPSPNGFYELQIAASFGLTEVVQLLLQRGADVDARDNSGGTPLYRAAENGHDAVVRLLLENGANVDMKDVVSGYGAIHRTALMGHTEVARLLLERGADVNAKCKDNNTPLVLAIGDGHEPVMRLLLEKGANVEMKDSDGDPPLHSAAYHGNEAMVQLLVEKGADVKAKGKSGRTALWWAAERGHEAVVRLLAEMGADVIDAEPRIKDDTNEVLGKVAGGRLLYDIEQAQQIMFHESFTRDWVQNLRFVVSATNAEDIDYHFELIERGADDEEANDEPYIAVSYCWGTNPSKETPLRILIPSGGQRGTMTRAIRAPPDVLQRSLAFAAAKGIRKIWIDQECIHQGDKEDVQKAIQNMHLVYQRAAITLVIMDRHIQTLGDVYALPEIKEFGVHQDLRERIVRDEWFTRAWTAQESASSRGGNLTYLIGWSDSVDVSGNVWELVATTSNGRGGPQQVVRREWELSHGQIHDIAHMCSNCPDVIASLSSNPLFGALDSGERIFTLIDGNVENTDWWGGGKSSCIGSNTPRGVVETRDISRAYHTHEWKRLKMPMTAAFTTLLRKKCLWTSDKLAILANLTGYPIRINTDRASELGLSFAACLIAIALYNGDLSPLFSQRKLPEYWSSGRRAEAFLHPLASWLPFHKLSLSDIVSMPSTQTRLRTQASCGSKCLVLGNKAIIEGLLWEVVPFRGLDTLRDSIREQQRLSDAGANGNATESGQISLFQLLVRRLLELERRDILELVVAAVMRRQLTSPDEMFHLLHELEEWYRGNRSWPTYIAEDSFLERGSPTASCSTRGERRDIEEVFTYVDDAGVRIALLSLKTPVGPGSKMCMKGGIWSGEDNPVIQWIYHTISNGLPLAIGKCNIGEETLASIFTIDLSEQQQMVFTPLSELEYEFGKNPWIHLFPKDSFWCVSVREDRVTDGDMQRARTKLGVAEGGDAHSALYLSDQILEVEEPVCNEEIKAIWSPRLSRIGMLTQEPEKKSWKMVPLGKGKGSVFR
ncbi:MAG: hypothetical protein M1839_008897 [Geoglossum umbratile]|nr:MAG: hypothetical protein M1839_008897 [Geoglossum umbratile]